MKKKSRGLDRIWHLLPLVLMFAFVGCNDEDDIESIFVGQTWYLGDFYTTTNWKDDNNQRSVYETNVEAVRLMRGNGQDRFYISFQESTFTAKGIGNTFSGTWSADGKTNRISFHVTQGASSSGSGLEQEITRKFYDYVNNAEFYRGNTIWIKFFPADRKSFMQLTKNRKTGD